VQVCWDIEQLERYEELKAENALLREQVQQEWPELIRKPPWQDVAKRFKQRRKKKLKGKPGGTNLGMRDMEAEAVSQKSNVNRLKTIAPERCIECGTALQNCDPEPYQVQLVETERRNIFTA